MFKSNSKLMVLGVMCWLFGGGAALAEDAAAPAEPSVAAKSEGAGVDETSASSTSTMALEAQHGGMPGGPAKNAVFLEGLGPGLLYSVNYERLVIPELAVRLGFSYLSMSASATSGGTTATASASFFTIPITATYVGLRGLEVGGGMTLFHASGSGSSVGVNASGSGFAPLGTLLVGYRLHPDNGVGFQFRVGAMAMMGEGLSLSTDNPGGFGVLPWLYLSAGVGF